MSPMALTENQIKSIELLLSGMPQKQVAKAIGVTPKTLQRWAKESEYQNKLNGVLAVATEQAIKKAIEKIETKTIEDMVLLGERDELRHEQYRKLQIAQNAIMSEVEQGNLRAISVFTKVSESIRLLYGLNVKGEVIDAIEVLLKAGILSHQQVKKLKNITSDMSRRLQNLNDEHEYTDLEKIDFDKLSNEQLERLAKGESPSVVLAGHFD